MFFTTVFHVENRELVYVLLVHLFFFFFFFFCFFFLFVLFCCFFVCFFFARVDFSLFFSLSSSWCQRLAANCVCGTPWTFLLTFLLVNFIIQNLAFGMN